MTAPLRFTPEEHDAFVTAKRQKRMAEIDRLPAATRELVHDYGWSVVNAFLSIGVTKPKHIKHLVETVLDEFSPTRGAFSSQGVRSAEWDKPEHQKAADDHRSPENEPHE